MMGDRIHLKIVTPSGVLLERSVNYVSIPTPEGSVGILQNHAPMLCAVGRGKVKCRFESGESSVAVSGGVASTGNNEVTILAEDVEIEG